MLFMLTLHVHAEQPWSLAQMMARTRSFRSRAVVAELLASVALAPNDVQTRRFISVGAALAAVLLERASVKHRRSGLDTERRHQGRLSSENNNRSGGVFITGNRRKC